MITRKCAVCGRDIEISLPYSEQYIYRKPKWYHIDCFTVVTTPRTHVGNWIKKTADYVTTEIYKENICQLLYNHYDLSCISQRLFRKLDQIYNGTYNGLSQPIPPQDLYDMLVRKMDYLDKCALKKGLKDEQRVNYDLGIMMKSYNSYKKWLAKIKAQQEELDEEIRRNKENPNRYKLYGYIPSDKPKEELIDYEETIE